MSRPPLDPRDQPDIPLLDDGPPDVPAPGDDQPQPLTIARAGSPVPVAYGNVKLPARLLEDGGVLASAPARRVASTQYRVGDVVVVATCWIGDYDYAAGAVISYAMQDLIFRCTVSGIASAYADFGVSFATAFGNTDLAATLMQARGSSLVTEPGSTLTWQYLQPADAVFANKTRRIVAALCEGQVVQARRAWIGKEKSAAVGTQDFGRSLFLSLGLDSETQDLGLGGAQHPSNYQHTACATAIALGLGTDSDLPELAFEIEAVMLGTTGSLDVNPADILVDLLTHTRRGAGWSGSKIDATTVTSAGASSWRTYCDAMGWRISWVIDTQRSILSLLADLAAATNTDPVWSQGVLKMLPRGDVAIAAPAYGVISYAPSNASVGSLGVDDFLDASEPVRVVRSSPADVFNAFPVEYVDRAQNNYQRTTVEDPDQIDVDARGLRRSPVVSVPFIYPNGQGPIALSRILAQRAVNIRNEYRWRASARWCLLDPGDVVTLTEPALGLVAVPVRITEITDDGDTLEFVAEDYPAAVSHAQGYAPEAPSATVAGYVDSLTVIAPGAGAGSSRVSGAAVEDGSIKFDALDVSSLRTNNYAEASNWATSTAYVAGDVRYANGNTYICTVAGTSAAVGSGPSGTGSAIVDGSAIWRWGIAGRSPVAGAKLDKSGTALKVAPQNLQVGSTILSSSVLGSSWVASLRWFEGSAGGGGSWFATLISVPAGVAVTPDQPGLRYIINIPATYLRGIDPTTMTGLICEWTGTVKSGGLSSDGAGGANLIHSVGSPMGPVSALVFVAAPPW